MVFTFIYNTISITLTSLSGILHLEDRWMDLRDQRGATFAMDEGKSDFIKKKLMAFTKSSK